MPAVNLPTPTPEQLHLIVTILVPLIDQLVAKNGSYWFKLGWSIVRPLIVAADPQTLAAAHAAVPSDARVA